MDDQNALDYSEQILRGRGRFCKTRMLFVVAGLYNFGLAIFFFISNPLGANFSLVHFAVALLLVFGIMFCNIAANPVRYKRLIPYAILRNVAYCALAGWYLRLGKLPDIWLIPAAVDLVLLLPFCCVFVRMLWEEDDL